MMEHGIVMKQGPLAGLRVVEFAGLGPAPFACMLLADMGADVVLVDRRGARIADPLQIVSRGRTLMHADLKSAGDRDSVLQLIDQADVLVEPEETMSRNPRLIYARMTGWGQSGALAQTAGHDINYISLAGALAAIGTRERPVPPLNLVGDYAGGSLYLIVGVLAALHEARQSGHGQVVDAAITDGVINLMAHFLAQSQRGSFQERRESNMLDGGVPWYGVYATADGRYMSVGAIEPQFFSVFVDRLGLDEGCKSAQFERERWLALRQAIADAFLSRTRAQWEQV